MLVNHERCVGCGNCVKYCALGAISIQAKKAVIDRDRCTECGSCYRSKSCKLGALTPEELDWPRLARSIMSDVTVVYKGIGGRGTEEMKTNDVTGRYKDGYSGVVIELGRPSVSSSLRDLEYIAKIVSEHGGVFEDRNPITAFMSNPSTGEIKPELLDERVMSGIIEVTIPNDRLIEMVEAVLEGSKHIDSVFSLGIACKIDKDGNIPARNILETIGLTPRPSYKVNVGLGRPEYKDWG